ncbi:MAG TPA: peptidylprolyl isomerase [Cytophagaceae bacterium]|jgi:peptidylprolyl isomerase/peptidyl-prolyl cis-trans isomerase B (cyclophilin B)
MKKIFSYAIAFQLLLLGTSCFAQKNLKKDHVVTIHTEFGDITILLYENTPLHKKNFIKLASEGYYNNTTFHRIIQDFMIQGGDPNSKDKDVNNDGTGGPGYTIPNELSAGHLHEPGAVAAARMGDNVNPKMESSGSQFYIVQNASGTHFLDKAYTVFGQTIKGMDVVNKIATQAKNQSDRPLKDITMTMKVEKLKVKKIIKKYDCQNFYQ